MPQIKNLYLSAIHQNAGKTTIALGLYHQFQERRLKASFLKPVGQKVLSIGKQDIDKDSYLISKVYHCQGRIKDMSPITVGRGFTEKYIFHPNHDFLHKEIRHSFDKLSRGTDVMIVEGTGHAGVGSVIDFSNADVASMLDSKVIIISEGGIGKSIDEIMLNKALFDLKRVEILGVIINKVLPEKYDKIKMHLAQGLANKNIRLLGVIPMDSMLTFPTVEQVMKELQLELLCGKTNLKTRVQHKIVAAMEPQNMVEYLKDGTLVITSGDRVDNILVSVSSHLISQRRKFRISGIVLTGGLVPSSSIVDLLKKSKIPVLTSKDDTFTVAGKVEALTCKIERTDKDKIAEATRLVREYVDIDAILKYL